MRLMFFTATLLLAPVTHADDATERQRLLDQTVVTATRTEATQSSTASSVTVIGAQEIRLRNKPTVQALLRTVPGLDVVGAGGPGGQTSIFARGTESNHVLVLIDGIEAGDPSNFNNQFDFASLTVNDIERIEVVRGSQSTLYGSDAIGGVINIITRQGTRGQALDQGVELEAGSFGTLLARAYTHSRIEQLSWGLRAGLIDTNGISAADEADGNSEEDASRTLTASGYLRVEPGQNSAVELSLRVIDSESQIDDYSSQDFSFSDDSDRLLKNQIVLARLRGELSLLDGQLRQTLGLTWTDYERDSLNGPQPSNTSSSDETFSGNKIKLEGLTRYDLTPSHHLMLGLDVETDAARTQDNLVGGPPGVDKSVTTIGLYLQEQFRFGELLSGTVALRHDDHEVFGGETTFRFTPLIVLRDGRTRLRGSLGQGFKAPALQELYAPFFGNPDLSPEISQSWDVGVEQIIGADQARLTLTWFDNRIEDLIGFDPSTFQAINIDEAHSRGFELTASAVLGGGFSLDANYTRTRARDETTGRDLLRRARAKAAAILNYDWRGRAQFNLEARHVGKRDDVGGELPAYEVVDLAATLNLRPKLALLLRVENLLDEDYQEILGFGTVGRSIYAGIRFARAAD